MVESYKVSVSRRHTRNSHSMSVFELKPFCRIMGRSKVLEISTETTEGA